MKKILTLSLISLFIQHTNAQEERSPEPGTFTENPPQEDVKQDKVESLPKESSGTQQTNKLSYVAKLLAGIPQDTHSEGLSLDTSSLWQDHKKEFDLIWEHFYNKTLSKLIVWRDSEIAPHTKQMTTVFYPFSGPDAIYPFTLFPNADQYILIGLESLGNFDELNIDEKVLPGLLKKFYTGSKSLFEKSFFVTAEMEHNISGNKLGTLPIILGFLGRLDHTPLDVKGIYLNTDGNPEEVEFKDPRIEGFVIECQDKNAHKKKIYYFKKNIQNGIKQKNIYAFLQKQQNVATIVKSASYLLHFKEFTEMVSLILDKSYMVVQDDSGIRYARFEKSKWNVNLYGTYTRPYGKEFHGYQQKDLLAAYQMKDNIGVIDFNLGYGYRRQPSALIIAIKK